jgi:SAM-dependent methyltransferase
MTEHAAYLDDGYLADNRASWDARSAAHARSRTYNIEQFVADPTHLSDVVRFDRPRLPELRGLRGVHLQCHIGTDTISLARLGARMTGLDFSPAALAEARRLSRRCGTPVEFVESDVYRALDALEPGSFDLVYTGVGALCWLPDIARWASVVAGLLRPGGRLFVREGHPMLWAIDDRHSDRLIVDHSYFERSESMVMYEGGSYVDDVVAPHIVTHEWNHGLGEIVTALLDYGMEITGLVEHDSVPWKAIRRQMTCDDRGEWRLADRPWRLAASYTLQARRRSDRLPDEGVPAQGSW